MKNFDDWVKRCIDFVNEHGIYETDSFTEEVIFAMEDGAERSLTDPERQRVTQLTGGRS